MNDDLSTTGELFARWGDFRPEGSMSTLASYAWSNGNKTLTTTVGARVAGSRNPVMVAAAWQLLPTTDTTKLRSTTGAFHVCDTAGAGEACRPSTPSSTL
ncbi:MAG TPA: hypothetical protein VMY34_02055 [Acidimicrobiales bacterium]|nr:hypothetical protein [Acidimicrobiales bacterium]